MFKIGLFAGAGVFPRGDVGVRVVVAQSFAVRRLKFLSEMAAARFVTLQRVLAHQLAELQKIRHTAGVFERLIEFFTAPEHVDVFPELLSQFGNALQRFLQAGFGARHSAVVPHQFAELPMK